MTEKKHLHPHHDIILAWLEGKQIQVKDGYINVSGGNRKRRWIDCPGPDGLTYPVFYRDQEYRIKPEIITLWYRNYISSVLRRDKSQKLKVRYIVLTVTSDDEEMQRRNEEDREKSTHFVKWCEDYSSFCEIDLNNPIKE